MRFGVLVVLCLGCASGPAPRPEGEPIAPSKVKTVAVSRDAAVSAIAGRAEALRLKVMSRAEDAGGVVLVLEAPLEKRAAVSAGYTGFGSVLISVFRSGVALRRSTHGEVEADQEEAEQR